MEFWTNLVISLAAIISINITMYLYQNVYNACCLIRSKSIDHHSSFTQRSSALKAVTLTYVHISSTCVLNLKKSKLSNFYFTKKPLLLTFYRSTMNCQFSYQCNKAPFWVSKGFFLKITFVIKAHAGWMLHQDLPLIKHALFLYLYVI